MSEDLENQAGEVTSQTPNDGLGGDLAKTGTEENWENKYRILQSKYDVEIQRLLKRTEFLEGLLANVTSEKKDVNSNGDFTDTSDPDITELAKEYPAIYRGMEKAINKAFEKVSDTVDKRFGSAKEESLMNSLKQFQSSLDDRAPNWRRINDDPAFLNWLQGKDKYSPYTRHQLLLEAYRQFDLNTVAAFFNGYAELSGQASKNRFVSPPTTTKPGVTTSPEKGTYTKEEITKFYNDLSRGRIKLTPAELKAEEEKIFKAMQEGRIVD